MKQNSRIIWISWGYHLRSKELSKYYGIPYFPLNCRGSRIIRYPILLIKTILLIRKKRPEIIIAQNPSVVLTYFLCFIKRVIKFKLIVDRHSNFKFGTERSTNPKWILFHKLSDFSLKKADLTILTNKPLAIIAEKKGATTAILPDKLPEIDTSGTPLELGNSLNFLFICTFSDDEPVEEVLAAFATLSGDFKVYITGNYKQKIGLYEKFKEFKNIVFLGFVSDTDYHRYLMACDATIVLTSMEMTLNCGSYESVTLTKPQIVADTIVIRNYFNRGAVYIKKFDVKHIINAVEYLKLNYERYRKEQEEMKKELEISWMNSALNLKNYIENKL